MSGPYRRFEPGELSDDAGAVASDAELAASAGVARELEMIAARDPGVSDDFTDRVMAAVAADPTPQPTAAFGAALRSGRILAAVAAVGDAWRVAIGSGRPLAVRGQALALVLVVMVGVVSLGGGAAVGAARLVAPALEPSPSPVLPSPSPVPSPSPTPTPTPLPSPTLSPVPTDQPEPTETPDATDDDDDDDDNETEEPGDDSSGRGSSGSGG